MKNLIRSTFLLAALAFGGSALAQWNNGTEEPPANPTPGTTWVQTIRDCGVASCIVERYYFRYAISGDPFNAIGYWDLYYFDMQIVPRNPVEK
ncbi:hypothetical protein C7S18_18300 [Ahniella affigens]|uniref:Uncharacterized protein n=1 Tax=Ahniella affigens TaxID=2021234 RepID=A0A2P1PVY0_9GAMM|nr:hypothetical protein [Ahniella affigens]AVP99007.1 hypothetical protein C7S18_18300 [Ahniella affigens]